MMNFLRYIFHRILGFEVYTCYFVSVGYLGEYELLIKSAETKENSWSRATTSDICQAKIFMKKEWAQEFVTKHNKAIGACKIIKKISLIRK